MNTVQSRRALLAGAPVVAAAALAGTSVNSLAAGLATPSSSDPIFAVIAEHRAALQHYDAAHEHFQAMDALYPREDGPDEFWSNWSVEERTAWRDAEIERAEQTPRYTAWERWSGQTAAVSESTEALVATIPTTAAGISAALEHWAAFSDRTAGDSQFDFLEFDYCSRLLTNVAVAIRNIIERGQA